MNWSIEYLKAQNILLILTSGVFSLELQRKMFEEIAEHENFSKSMPLLFDNRLIDMNRADAETIRMSVLVLQNFYRLKSKSKIAGLVNRTDVNFGFGRQFETISEFGDEVEFRLFVDEAIAIQWLTTTDLRQE